MFVQSGQKLLFISLAIVFLFGCKSEREDPVKIISGGELESKFEKLEGNDLLNEASLLLGEDVFFASLDFYIDSKEKSLAVISTEKKNRTTYGVKFALVEFSDQLAEIKFSTDFLDGIKETSDFGLKEFHEPNRSLLFYNSRSSFVGSGGGELFLYLFEVKTGELFSFYFIEENQKIKLELSENLKEIQNILLKDWLFTEGQKIIPEIYTHKGSESYVTK